MDSKNTFVKMIEAMKSVQEKRSGRTPEIILYTAGGMVKGTLNLEMMNTLYSFGDKLSKVGGLSEAYREGDVVALKDVTIGFPALNACKINEMYFHKDAILGFMLFDGSVDYKRCALPEN